MATIIFLNGVSSCGKSSVARELQNLFLPEVYLHIGIDNFLYLLPWDLVGTTPEAKNWFYFAQGIEDDKPITKVEVGREGKEYYKVAQSIIATLADRDYNLIIDEVLLSKESLSEYVKLFKNHKALFVGIQCPLDIAEERERSRGDRVLGLARAQFDIVHSFAPYDITINSATCSLQEVARYIKEALETCEPKVFKRYRKD